MTAAGSTTATAEGAAGSGFCRVERDYLLLADSTSLYVEPQSLFPLGSRWVVAGLPTWSWWPGDSPTGVWWTTDQYAGATLGPGLSTAFPNPLERIQAVRAAPLDETRWGALLFQYEGELFPDLGRMLGVYYLEHDGESWSAPQSLEFPEIGLRVFESSALVNASGRLLWAAALEVDSGEAPLLLYERREGRWSSRTLSESFTERVALGWDGTNAWLVVTGEDPDLPEWRRSVRLYREVQPGGEWELVSRVWVAPLGTNVWTVSLTLLESGATVSWETMRERPSHAMARIGIGLGRRGRLAILDTSPAQVVALAMPDQSPAWVVNHVNGLTGTTTLRFLNYRQGRVVEMGSIPNPYGPYFAARVTGEGEVLVVGGEPHLDLIQPTVRSLTLRLSTACD